MIRYTAVVLCTNRVFLRQPKNSKFK
uniref:Uncharacterized protein n=1 Tax=Anguilla anguilla TaxID=7936 RepID=A0A0E9S5E6_ANGAN